MAATPVAVVNRSERHSISISDGNIFVGTARRSRRHPPSGDLAFAREHYNDQSIIGSLDRHLAMQRAA